MLTIFMPLLDEGTDCWRPVHATFLGAQIYRVEGEIPQDEAWAFSPGSVVICEMREFQSGESGMTAVELAR